jgi:NAD(P)-dependent dehydrogenase (short-subunit alcohol dehydrogenase family)
MLGPALGIRAVLPHMLRDGRGSIINVSSIYGAKAVAGEAAYHASKAALLGLTRNAAATYSGNGIRVNALLPGLVMTPMTAGQDANSNSALIAATPMRRAVSPAELIGPAVFLASDEASFVTGVALPVDGASWPSRARPRVVSGRWPVLIATRRRSDASANKDPKSC